MLLRLMKIRSVVSIILVSATLFTLNSFLFQQKAFSSDNTNHGFRLIKQSYLDSIQSTVYQYEHIKSGAKLIFIKNSDDNKTFSISFRTPPEDNSGVNHIIEHCLLDGSEKYPVKSIISTMQSRSMNTFFNAYTTGDITGYIAASSNEKDFQNLLRIYMDAVLHPNLLKNKNIFLQEAGHYEIEAPQSELRYNGVVYNEMKGAGSPLDILYSKIYESLLPDSVYRWDSGGNPAKISELSYQTLIETYRKYYHPSNSYIYLYGNPDIDKTLGILDSEFLINYTRTEINSDIAPQPALANRVKAAYEYRAAYEAAAEKGTYLAWSCLLGKATNAEESAAFEMIAALLFSEGSPFRKALADKGFDNVSYSLDTMLQPIFTVLCENCATNRSDEFAAVIENELNKIISNGFDKNEIAAMLHSYELKPYQEMVTLGSNRGIIYSRKVMSTWLYDGDPFASLDYAMNIDILKKELSGHYFAGLISQYMINNKHQAIIALKPAAGHQEDAVEAEKKRFNQYKASLGTDQINALIKQAEDLKKWQSTPDSAETLSKIPVLELADVGKKSSCYIAPRADTWHGTSVLYTPADKSNMSCINLYFDTTTVPQDKIQYIRLLESILGRVPTEKYDANAIANQLQSNTFGDLSFFSYHFGNIVQTDKYSPKMMVSISTLDKDFDQTINLLNQIMVRSVFNDKALLKSIIHDQKNQMEASATSNYMALLRFYSYISDKDRYYENLYGYPYYAFLSKLDADFEKNPDEVISNITQVYHCIFHRNNLILGFVGSNKAYAKYRSGLGSLFAGMNDARLKIYRYRFSDRYVNEGLISRQNVNSVVKGYNIKKLGYKYNGKIAVLENILNEYLNNEVREKGGAYSGKAEITQDGNIAFISGRDPSITNTLDVYANTVSYLKNFKAADHEMTNYIISTIARMDAETDANIFNKARISQQLYIMGGSQEFYQQERDEIMSTTMNDIHSMTGMIEAVLDENCFCAAGSKTDITTQKSLFNQIVDLSAQK